MKTRRIEFVYFDLGNVLLAFDHRLASERIAELVGVDGQRVEQVVFRSGLQDRYETGEVSSSQFHQSCVEELGECDETELLLALSDIFWPIAEVDRLVRRLKLAGCRLGVLSNTCEAHWRFVTERYPVLQQFEVLALSYELGCMKPAEPIYAQAAKLAETSPNEIFFVDDRSENVEAAKRAGFDAVRFNAPNELARQLAERELL